jgi:hypothetical protein
MNMNDILTRLQNGESSDAIANDLSKMMNDAMAEYKRIEDEKKAAAEAESAKETRMDEIAAEMGELFLEYMRLAAPGLAEHTNGIEAGEIMVDAMRGTIETLKALECMFSKSKEVCGDVGPKIKKAKVHVVENAEDAANQIANFLKEIGLR